MSYQLGRLTGYRYVGATHIWHGAAATLLACIFSSCAPPEGVTSVGSSGGAPPATTGGTTGTGGSGTGGAGTGGSGTGGAGTGGAATGGSGTGGAATGGAATGGSGTGGAGGRAMGTGGAGTAGRTGAGGAASTALCPPGALVCEDFEDGMAQGWSALGAGMTIDTQHPAHGTNSVLLNIAAGGRGSMISLKGAPLFPLVNKIMWGRMMVWFDTVADGHTDIVKGQGASGGNPAYNVAEQHGAYMMNYYNGSGATDCWARPKAPTPTKVAVGKWMCWEWQFDAATNHMEFYVDGPLYRAVNMTGDGCLTGNGVWVAPTDFGMVSVGASIAETGTAMKMWFDDVAIGTAGRIGCPAP